MGLNLCVRVWYRREGHQASTLFDVDVDAEPKLDEVDAWRSIVFVSEEGFLWCKLNGRQALMVTILLLYSLEVE
jgi:hypothetical protein